MLFKLTLRDLAQGNRITLAYFGFALMAMAARWHYFVHHDGLVFIRCAFLPEEWEGYALASGLPTGSFDLDSRWPTLLCVAWMKKP